MTRKTVVLNVVGLTPELIGPDTPRLSQWGKQAQIATIREVTPAVTCSVQATYMTGVYPDQHGIVGNGWYFRDECEIRFWRQSNRLVQAPKLWERIRERDSSFTCANLFWWYNMYSTVDYSVTPRPMYPADGRKLPDVYTQPARLRSDLQAKLGRFPLFEFWGPRTSIRSSQWIAEAAKHVERAHGPTLTLVYLPHLDYGLQRWGPSSSRIRPDLRDIDQVCGDLIDFYEERGAQVVVLSEYGITDVSRPVHLNRVLRQHGLIAVRDELGRELLDAGACEAFAVADHQVAHVYVKNPARLAQVRQLLEATPGVARVLDRSGQDEYHLGHSRSGELVALAEPDSWFTYYYWGDDRRAPDYARTVDIHRKPGYDPVELFVDPELKLPQFKAAGILLKKQLGIRYLMDLISLDASLVKGSHGLPAREIRRRPLMMTRNPDVQLESEIDAAAVHDLLLRHVLT